MMDDFVIRDGGLDNIGRIVIQAAGAIGYMMPVLITMNEDGASDWELDIHGILMISGFLRPNWWHRLWHSVLLGWRWERVERTTDGKTTET